MLLGQKEPCGRWIVDPVSEKWVVEEDGYDGKRDDAGRVLAEITDAGVLLSDGARP